MLAKLNGYELLLLRIFAGDIGGAIPHELDRRSGKGTKLPPIQTATPEALITKSVAQRAQRYIRTGIAA